MVTIFRLDVSVETFRVRREWGVGSRNISGRGVLIEQWLKNIRIGLVRIHRWGIYNSLIYLLYLYDIYVKTEDEKVTQHVLPV